VALDHVHLDLRPHRRRGPPALQVVRAVISRDHVNLFEPMLHRVAGRSRLELLTRAHNQLV
jgi:hypothetical protein